MKVATFVALTILTMSSAQAHEFRVGDMFVNHPWSRPTQANETDGVGYVTITNFGTASDKLVGGSSDMSERFEMYRSDTGDGVVHTRPVPEGLTIGAGETVDLNSKAVHFKLTRLKRPLLADGSFSAQLVFEKAGAVPVQFKVEPVGPSIPIQDTHGR